ncbi:MAG: phosphoribosylamine--glycine ligase [Chloroflexi bacterium]|nr:phosphoribosylamine--glycine ligase [Chloroflexota bacterium]
MWDKNVLVIGSGGREHALAWKLAQSPQVKQVYAAPGNGGMDWDASGTLAPCESVPLNVNEVEDLIHFARKLDIHLTVVGPEVPLVDGIVDAFQDEGLTIFGPSKAVARLEGSKAFAKDFMREHGIPTSDYAIFQDYDAALDYVKNRPAQVVVKASGLAAGKGVIVADNVEEAENGLHKIFHEKVFGAAGDTVVIEDRLTGKEASVLAFSDGATLKTMLVARDYKRAFDEDQGSNTGGMGAIAPVDDLSPEMLDYIRATALQPVIDGMAKRGTPYKGVLYAGMMLTGDEPQVLEYNVRFGDPETQVILPLLKTDLYDILMACMSGTLHEIDLQWHDGAAAGVVLASGGYPDKYETGKPVTGLDKLADDIIVFHAGTHREDEDLLVTSGGRVMTVVSHQQDHNVALKKVYDAVETIQFDGKHYRTDIGA